MKQTPADGGNLVALPVGAQGGMLEQDEQVVGNDADAEERGVGGKLSAGHTFHAEADFQLLDPFAEVSPRWRYQIRVSAVDSARLLTMT